MHHPRRLSNVSYTPISAVSAGAPAESFSYDPKAVAREGLGVFTAAIFLAGEMAGSGVLALPASMIGTGWLGIALVLLFSVNACFSGTRLGLCWVLLEARYPEFGGIIRDPYPTIGEKAVGQWGRILSLCCICVTLYGGGCVFIVLIAQITSSLMHTYLAIQITLCWAMCIVAAVLVPITWLGTPKDFWPVAVGALVTTVLACLLIVVQSMLDYTWMERHWEQVQYPRPTLMGSFKTFATMMFAFAGASTFPTIQADMRHREKFSMAAIIACTILFLIYLPMASVGYFVYGADVEDNIVLSISAGPLRLVVEVLLLLHLVAAFPIITNPPAQFFEYKLNIPSEFSLKRCLFRSFSVAMLLLLALSVPSFGSILDLVGASTVTLLTFVLPPYFYLRLCDQPRPPGHPDDLPWMVRDVGVGERVYCWALIALGTAGGVCATYTAVTNVVSTEFIMPCYIS